MKNKYLYGKVVFSNDTTLLILMNENRILSYRLFNSLTKEKRTLSSLGLQIPLPDYKWEIKNPKGEHLNLTKDENIDYLRTILESSVTKDTSGEKYYKILSIEII